MIERRVVALKKARQRGDVEQQNEVKWPCANYSNQSMTTFFLLNYDVSDLYFNAIVVSEKPLFQPRTPGIRSNLETCRM